MRGMNLNKRISLMLEDIVLFGPAQLHVNEVELHSNARSTERTSVIVPPNYLDAISATSFVLARFQFY